MASHAPSAHAHHGHGGGGPLKTSAQATLHCLTGCVIGEVAGLVIGVSLGFSPWQTIALATALAYAAGITLGLLPVMRAAEIGALDALQDHLAGRGHLDRRDGDRDELRRLSDGRDGRAVGRLAGCSGAASLFAIPAGFLAAWPVNYWLLKREIKAPCH